MKIDIKQIKPNPKNPRVIKDANFEKLKRSIEEFPEMLEKRPLVCYTDTDNKLVVLGGNMRLKAAKELKIAELPVILADDWTAEQKEQFIIRDNVSGGEWDWEALTDWEKGELAEWGVDVLANQIKETKEIPEIGQIEFSEDLFLEHNYIVLYFDNPMDWEVAKEVYGLKQVKSLDSSDNTKKIGIGRVINGKNFI
jgi:hypothetical protein